MLVKPNYSEANPDEVEPYGMDFFGSLAPGEIILTATVTLTVVPGNGTDANPQSHVTGPAAWVGSKVSQMISHLVGGVLYCMLFTVTTSAGKTLELYCHVFCKVPK